MLSIILQILFENIIELENSDDESVYDELWFTITHNGLQSLEKYVEYLVPVALNEQLNSEQSILFQVLQEFYREKLLKFFQENKVINRANLYELALDNITKLGWMNGLKQIQNKFIPKNFQILLEKIQIYLKDEQKLFEKQSKYFFLISRRQLDLGEFKTNSTFYMTHLYNRSYNTILFF